MSGRPAVTRLNTPAQADDADPECTAFLRMVGRRIRVLRYQREMTQEELADATGISRNFISVIEHGQHGMNLIRLLAIARAVGVEPWELLQPVPTQVAPT